MLENVYLDGVLEVFIKKKTGNSFLVGPQQMSTAFTGQHQLPQMRPRFRSNLKRGRMGPKIGVTIFPPLGDP